MANKNIYEVFNEFKSATTKKDRQDVLRRNDSWALRSILQGAFNKNIQFIIKETPTYKSEDVPPGMSYNHMTHALQKVYLFTCDDPRSPPALTDERRKQLLIQILESLEPLEAEIFANMLKKDLKVPYLTPALINEVFQDLLPKS